MALAINIVLGANCSLLIFITPLKAKTVFAFAYIQNGKLFSVLPVFHTIFYFSNFGFNAFMLSLKTNGNL